MKAVIYTRFSPRPDSSTCQSIEVQRNLCEKYCADNGHQVVCIYDDPDSSGGDGEREVLWSAVAATKRGYVLVVYDLDRLARRLDTQMAVEEELRSSGASLEIATGAPGGADPLSKLIRHILAAVSEFDRCVKAQRTSIHMKRMQAAGRSMGGVPPFGKSVNGKDLVDCPAELEAIELIDRWRKKGLSYHKIAHGLNKLHVPGRRGSWYATSVRRIYLRNEGVENER